MEVIVDSALGATLEEDRPNDGPRAAHQGAEEERHCVAACCTTMPLRLTTSSKSAPGQLSSVLVRTEDWRSQLMHDGDGRHKEDAISATIKAHVHILVVQRYVLTLQVT